MKKHNLKARLYKTKGKKVFSYHLGRFVSGRDYVFTLYGFVALNIPGRFGFMFEMSYLTPLAEWELPKSNREAI